MQKSKLRLDPKPTFIFERGKKRQAVGFTLNLSLSFGKYHYFLYIFVPNKRLVKREYIQGNLKIQTHDGPSRPDKYTAGSPTRYRESAIEISDRIKD